MNRTHELGRLEWLLGLLGAQRTRIADLLRRVSACEPPHAQNMNILQKFIYLLQDVSTARDEEIKLISEIEAIEKKHRINRENHTLRHTCPETHLGSSDVHETYRPVHGWVWISAIWCLVTGRRINQKKHDLTVD